MAALKRKIPRVIPPPGLSEMVDLKDDGTTSRMPHFFCMYRGANTVALLQKYATESKNVDHMIFTTAEKDVNGVDMVVGFVQFMTNRTAKGIIGRHYPWADCKYMAPRKLRLPLKECQRFIHGPWIGDGGLVHRVCQYPHIWQHGVDKPNYEAQLASKIVSMGRRDDIHPDNTADTAATSEESPNTEDEENTAIKSVKIDGQDAVHLDVIAGTCAVPPEVKNEEMFIKREMVAAKVVRWDDDSIDELDRMMVVMEKKGINPADWIRVFRQGVEMVGVRTTVGHI